MELIKNRGSILFLLFASVEYFTHFTSHRAAHNTVLSFLGYYALLS